MKFKNIRDLIEKYVMSETKAEQEHYAKELGKIDFFEYIHEHSRRVLNERGKKV